MRIYVLILSLCSRRHDLTALNNFIGRRDRGVKGSIHSGLSALAKNADLFIRNHLFLLGVKILLLLKKSVELAPSVGIKSCVQAHNILLRLALYRGCKAASVNMHLPCSRLPYLALRVAETSRLWEVLHPKSSLSHLYTFK